MPHKLYDWLDRFKSVEREYRAVRSSVAHIRTAVAEGTAALTGAKVGDLVAADENLEGSYLIRPWAEFETAVRSYFDWLTNHTNSRIGTLDLINAVAGVRRGRAISEDVRRAVQAVREYRNTLVHARDDPSDAVALTDARRAMNTFMCKLPETWG